MWWIIGGFVVTLILALFVAGDFILYVTSGNHYEDG